MKRATACVGVALLLVNLCSCGSGAGGAPGVGGAGSMAVLSCSLGCNGSGGGPQSCSVTAVHVNQDIWLEFTHPVDMSTVTKNSFRVVNAITGSAPPGYYAQDPSNPRRIAFKSQIAFDATGVPSFGLEPGNAYRVTLQGAKDGGAPVVRSIHGQPNTTSIDCFVQASLGIVDMAPGPPSVGVWVEELVGAGAVSSQLAAGAADVALDSRLRLVFDDVMNPATLVNPITGTPVFLSVRVDLDGNPSTTDDQLVQPGTWGIAIDDFAKTTTVTFTPSGGFPSSGATSGGVRRILVELPPTILDLGGNPLANHGVVSFATKAIAYPPVLLPAGTGEDFTTATHVDLRRTGALLVGASGRVLPGFGGGSGRLGDFRVAGNQTVTISTGPTGGPSFGPLVAPAPAVGSTRTFVLDNYDPLAGEVPGTTDIAVNDGIFEFASLDIDPGAVVRFEGSNPARIFVRGEARIRGLLVVSGRAPAASPSSLPGGQHNGSQFLGQPGGAGGPKAGAGGAGGDRQNLTGTPLAGIGAAAPGVGVPFDMVGRAGAGRAGVPGEGGGAGGARWPAVHPGPAVNQYGGFAANFFCFSVQVGGPGGGGSFGAFGTTSTWIAPAAFAGVPPAPPAAAAGATLVRATDTTLDPEVGALVGGAGGGGGGAGLAGTLSTGLPGPGGCALQPASFLVTYSDASGAGGGGGGGALQVQAGRRLLVEGTIEARGGAGGAPMLPVVLLGTQNVDGKAMSAPGGGGSGGSVLLQALQLDVAQTGQAVDLRGGPGGTSPLPLMVPPHHNPSRGGDGGPGIVRFERSPLQSMTVASEAIKVLPATGGFGQPPSQDIVAVATFAPKAVGPGRQSGIQSCWMRPSGAPLVVDFVADDFADPLAPVLGWNMSVGLTGLPLPLEYRGPSLVQQLLGADLETLLGGDLGSSPIVVRFQGARVLGPLAQPCAADPTDPLGPFVIGSATPWVRHPAELNGYWSTVHPNDPATAAKLKPNAIRYQIVFDRSELLGDQWELLDLSILAQPD